MGRMEASGGSRSGAKLDHPILGVGVNNNVD